MMKIVFRIALMTLILPCSVNAQIRNDAGLRGDAGATSGFFETNAPVNFPAGATDWWHLLDVRHSNTINNMAMQFSGSFYDQNLFFRKTINNASQPWSRILLERDGKVGIGTLNPMSGLHLGAGTTDLISLGVTNYGGGNGQALGGIKAGQMPGGEGGTLEFQTLQWGGNPYDLTTKMILMGNTGNVGIGTSNPLQRLTVLMDATSNGNGIAVQAVTSLGNGSQPAFSFLNSTGSRRMYSFLDINTDTYNLANGANTPVLTVNQAGSVSIGTMDAKGYKLAVAGNMIAESVKVKLQGAWPDFVFANSYKFPTLQETEAHIKENGHLPGIPSAAEVKLKGIDLGEMNAKLLEKIEELTLHLIETEKNNNRQQMELGELRKIIENLTDRLGRIEKN